MQVRLFRGTYVREGELALRDLYTRWYVMSDYEQAILGGLGLAREVICDRIYRHDWGCHFYTEEEIASFNGRGP